LQLVAGSSVDILMLDMVVVVVLAEDVVAEVGVLESMSVSWMTATAWFKFVKIVGHIWGISNEIGEVKGCQLG
jgi:hypothetical protein